MGDRPAEALEVLRVARAERPKVNVFLDARSSFLLARALAFDSAGRKEAHDLAAGALSLLGEQDETRRSLVSAWLADHPPK